MFQRWITSGNLGLGLRIAVGVAAATVAVALRLALTPLLGDTIPFLTFFPAILIASALAGGVGGAVCLGLATGYGVYFFVPPTWTLPADTRSWLAALMMLASGGLIVLVTMQLRAALIEVARARAREHLLLLEVQHRAKNTLAVVQSVAAQTFRGASDVASVRRSFTDRLVALGQAHNLLSEQAWGPVLLRTLAERTLEPFNAGGQVSLEGEAVWIPPDIVVDLGLCLHELATNAVKHGALSEGVGRVEISWRTTSGPSGPRLRLEWRERGGPDVLRPAQGGFGSRLLQEGLSARVRPEVELEFLPGGLLWRAHFDLAEAPAYEAVREAARGDQEFARAGRRQEYRASAAAGRAPPRASSRAHARSSR